jgi:type VI secretion system protein ImpF
MSGFTPGLFDRLDADSDTGQAPRAQHQERVRVFEECKRSVMRDLEALLNTRVALLPAAIAAYPAVSDSVVNYGLMDFGGMSFASDSDQKKICAMVRKAIARHEPRLRNVEVTLRPRKGAINRVDFIITAQLKHEQRSEALAFNVVFRPSLQQYSIDGEI